MVKMVHLHLEDLHWNLADTHKSYAVSEKVSGYNWSSASELPLTGGHCVVFFPEYTVGINTELPNGRAGGYQWHFTVFRAPTTLAVKFPKNKWEG